ncbi:hypothetical protein [Pseudoduganella sp. HUAS MS19]
MSHSRSSPSTVVVDELRRVGIAQVQAESIAKDLSAHDARSLLSELLLRGLWSLVIDEKDPSHLSAVGGHSVQRLLDKGVDPDDLMDVVRETQVDIIYNVAQLVDWPTFGLQLEHVPGLTISVSAEVEKKRWRGVEGLYGRGAGIARASVLIFISDQ